MKSIKLLALFLMIVSKAAFASNHEIEGTYSFQLYFGNSKPFTDELTLKKDQDGVYSGSMHVPNDFDADLEGIIERDSGASIELTFSIALPPKYHHSIGRRLNYRLIFLKRRPDIVNYKEEFVGFVTKSDSFLPTYIGSLVGFKKEE